KEDRSITRKSAATKPRNVAEIMVRPLTSKLFLSRGQFMVGMCASGFLRFAIGELSAHEWYGAFRMVKRRKGRLPISSQQNFVDRCGGLVQVSEQGRPVGFQERYSQLVHGSSFQGMGVDQLPRNLRLLEVIKEPFRGVPMRRATNDSNGVWNQECLLVNGQ